MAVSVQDIGVVKHGFSIAATSADFSGGEELIAAPGAGKAIVLQSLQVAPSATITITFSEGATDIIGRLTCSSSITPPPIKFGREGMQLAENAAFNATSTGAASAVVYVKGKYVEV